MNPHASQCTLCMPNGRKHVATDKNAALLLYQDLHARGAFPVMCQQDGNTFHVCHEQQQTAWPRQQANRSSRVGIDCR